jgi:hypothetical protein
MSRRRGPAVRSAPGARACRELSNTLLALVDADPTDVTKAFEAPTACSSTPLLGQWVSGLVFIAGRRLWWSDAGAATASSTCSAPDIHAAAARTQGRANGYLRIAIRPRLAGWEVLWLDVDAGIFRLEQCAGAEHAVILEDADFWSRGALRALHSGNWPRLPRVSRHGLGAICGPGRQSSAASSRPQWVDVALGPFTDERRLRSSVHGAPRKNELINHSRLHRAKSGALHDAIDFWAHARPEHAYQRISAPALARQTLDEHRAPSDLRTGTRASVATGGSVARRVADKSVDSRDRRSGRTRHDRGQRFAISSGPASERTATGWRIVPSFMQIGFSISQSSARYRNG